LAADRIIFEDTWPIRSDLIKRGIYLAEGCRIGAPLLLESPLELPGGVSIDPFGSGVTIGGFTYSWSTITGSVRSIGRYCSLASQIIFGDMEHPTDCLSTSSFIYDREWMWGAFAERTGAERVSTLEVGALNRPIEIGNDVWVGNGAYIKRGLRLGDGCIVGAKAVVTRDVPPYAIVAGNPARIIRFRFNEALRERLLASRWWDHAFTDLGPDATWNDVERMLDIMDRRRETGDLAPYRGGTIELVSRDVTGG
jgi:virginiamycin A acetyltransferase